MKMRVSRWGLLALLVPLGLLALVIAQEGERTAAPPGSVAAPAKPAEPPVADEGNEEEAEELLPPGERLSADNNLSWPVDI
jgi:hypothetical protein